MATIADYERKRLADKMDDALSNGQLNRAAHLAVKMVSDTNPALAKTLAELAELIDRMQDGEPEKKDPEFGRMLEQLAQLTDE